ncbi:hypothetical protein C8J57DRAFT_1243455 [Mycena rebaudengoi]|nr:hypothetical protein C8J57DRAFT_1243455 [Mycena rebaudengoi]
MNVSTRTVKESKAALPSTLMESVLSPPRMRAPPFRPSSQSRGAMSEAVRGLLPSTPRMPDNAQDNLQLLQLVADSRLTGYLAGTCVSSLLNSLQFVCSYEVGFFCGDSVGFFCGDLSCELSILQVELMWKSRWGFAKIIYVGHVLRVSAERRFSRLFFKLFNRYFSLISICLLTGLHRKYSTRYDQAASSALIGSTAFFGVGPCAPHRPSAHTQLETFKEVQQLAGQERGSERQNLISTWRYRPIKFASFHELAPKPRF